MAAKQLDYSKKTLAIITGASQGIGRTLALELARKSSSLTLILIARSEQGLEATKASVEDIDNKATVKIVALDLTSPDKHVLKAIIDDATCDKEFESAIIFHNVGQIGTLAPVSELTDIQNWRGYFDLNLFSVAILNSAFLQLPVRPIFVVNVTSLVGRQPFKNMGMYGTGKAARDMLFKVLAEEEKDVTVLNYSPGPVDTAMVAGVIRNVKDDGIRQMFSSMVDNQTILKPAETVGKLLEVLENGSYSSGDVVDYYDRI